MKCLLQAVSALSSVLLLPRPLTAADLRFGTSTVTAGVGSTVAIAGESTRSYGAGVAVPAEYEFALHRFISATLGVQNFFPTRSECNRFGCTPVRERFTLMPFGLRGIIPLGGGVGELFVGSGGARLFTTDPLFGDSFRRDELLWHTNAGIRIAINRDRRFRLGPTVRMNRDVGRPRQVWLSVTVDFSYRFGP